MERVNVFELKARLSEFLARIERGERILICRRNQPVAEIRSVAAARTAPRPVGGAKGQFTVPASFFAPLPADVLDDFEGSTIAFASAPSSVAVVSMAREGPTAVVPPPSRRSAATVRASRQTTKTKAARKRSR